MILTPCPYGPNNDYVCSNTKCPAGEQRIGKCSGELNGYKCRACPNGKCGDPNAPPPSDVEEEVGYSARKIPAAAPFAPYYPFFQSKNLYWGLYMEFYCGLT